jgi:hypothetical protein
MDRVEITDECWLFTGFTDDGYGRIKVDGSMERTHRVAYRLMVGDIPEGMHVLHRCDVRNCVRPDHLWIGDNAANMKDRNDKGRARGRFSKERVA